MTEAPPRRRRADAERSRAALIDAAATLFAREGPRAPLDRVAELAGVGSATLHRHFAGRAELLNAVVGRVTEQLAARGRDEYRRTSDPNGLWRWLDTVIRDCALDRSVADAADPSAADPETSWAPLIEAGQPLLERARAGGALDPGVGITDLLRLVNAIAPAGGDPTEAVRLFAMVRRGLEGTSEARAAAPALP